MCERIIDVLQVDDCRFDPGNGLILAALGDDGTVTYNGGRFDVDRLGLPTDAEIALVVRSGGVVRGRLLLTAASRVVRPSRGPLRVAGALANQAALAVAGFNGAPAKQ